MSEPTEELERTCVALRAEGVDLAVFCTPANVTYVSGFEAPIAVGPISDVIAGAPLAYAIVRASDGAGWLVVADAYASAASASPFEVAAFGSLGHFEPIDPAAEARERLRAALTAAGLDGAPAAVGVEPGSLPTIVRDLVVGLGADVRLRDGGRALERARWIKTEREIGLLRRAARVADAAQTRLVELAASAGANELDVWRELRAAMESEAGGPLTVTGELVTGDRIRTVAPGGPRDRIIAAGDAGLLDISPRVAGYWSDCTNDVVFGAPPSALQRRYFDAARSGLEAGIDALRPGRRASEVAEAVRAAFERRGFGVTHYHGHQIGASVNERPRLVPYEDAVIEPGMVFALEPGVYGAAVDAAGARAERIVVVRDDGPEVLHAFPWGIQG